jgi:leucyl/phenylalanyl-tRNA--protein transferase
MDVPNLTPELLLGAYASGVFPMAESQHVPDVYWVDPRRRGIFPLDGFHVSRTLRRSLLRPDYSVTLDSEFSSILGACADRSETWINSTIRELMISLHNLGHAHAFGIWRGNELVGGLYGLAIGGAFFGESMFSRATDASKIALVWTIDHLRRTGFTLFDTQFLTPHLASLGALEVPRARYHLLLEIALAQDADIRRVALETDRQTVVQRMTQTS